MIREKRVSNLDQSEVNLVYQYDASGAIIGFTYHPYSGTATQYFFGKNAQGDVICIYDANNNTVARYNYDAWGTCTVAYDNTSIGIANINPIRYRSYYYDAETGWYYLQSRYYDPTVGRFISPDDPSLLGANGDLLSYNLYAYCSNNPVNYSDPTGESILLTMFVGGIIGGIISGSFAIYNQVKLHGWDSSQWDGLQILRSTLGGFAAGFISAFPLGGWKVALLTGAGGSAFGGWVSGSVYDLDTALQAATIGAIANLIAYGINQKILNHKAGKIFNQSNKAKSLSVQQLQAHPANMGPIALQGTYRNAFKTVTKVEIATLLKKANPLFIYGIYSSPISSLLSGWY